MEAMAAYGSERVLHYSNTVDWGDNESENPSNRDGHPEGWSSDGVLCGSK